MTLVLPLRGPSASGSGAVASAQVETRGNEPGSPGSRRAPSGPRCNTLALCWSTKQIETIASQTAHAGLPLTGGFRAIREITTAESKRFTHSAGRTL